MSNWYTKAIDIALKKKGSETYRVSGNRHHGVIVTKEGNFQYELEAVNFTPIILWDFDGNHLYYIVALKKFQIDGKEVL